MRNVFIFTALLSFQVSFCQTKVESKKNGELEFVELDHGLADVVEGTINKTKKTPTGEHMWLKDFVIVKVTDSIKIAPKANFGVVYMVKAKDTVDIDVVIEWIYPEKITNEKGQKFKSVKYTTHRPTNIPSASSYSLDAPYEMVKGNWQMNIYLEKKLVCARTFFLY